MTKNIGKRKDRTKYNHSHKGGTYSTKRDYIEADYVKGLYDKEGNEIMRPLNKEEAAFLDNFYKETVHAKLNNSDLSRELMVRIKKLRREVAEDHPELIETIKQYELEKKRLGNTYYTLDDTKRIYSENYSRNNCAFNILSKTENMLMSIQDGYFEGDEDEEDGILELEDLIVKSEK